MPNKTTHIPLPDLPRELRARGLAVSYVTVWRAAVAGEIPAAKVNGTRWVYDPADLDTITLAFAGSAR